MMFVSSVHRRLLCTGLAESFMCSQCRVYLYADIHLLKFNENKRNLIKIFHYLIYIHQYSTCT